MARSLTKYFQDRGGDEHGGARLSWPGTLEGFPFRGNAVPSLKQKETEEIPLEFDFKSKLFNLWDEADKKYYDFVCDRILNGWYVKLNKIERWHPEGNGLMIWLEWGQIYGSTPRREGINVGDVDDVL